MIFSFYQNSKNFNFPDTQSGVSQINSQKKSVHPEEIQHKDKSQYEKLNWIKKKYAQIQQLNRLSPINGLGKHNFSNATASKFFMKSRTILNYKQDQQNHLKRQKRFHSESEYFDQKRKKSQISKIFNQTLIDNQHNFIGKNYLKQVQHCKTNATHSNQTSPKKIIITTKSKLYNKQQIPLLPPASKIPKISCNQSQSYWQKQQYSAKKKFSLNDRLLTKTSFDDIENYQRRNQSELINEKLIKQIEQNVKKDIKAEMTKFKKSKLQKFKLKSNSFKTPKKSLHIMRNKTDSIFKKSQSSSTSPQKTIGLIVKYNKTNVQQVKRIQSKKIKSHSSFNNYENDDNRIKSKYMAYPISEELDPWQIENVDFYGLG